MMGSGLSIWARDSRVAGFVILAAGMCTSTYAQNARLNPVDQGVADVGPLSASQRVVPSDLRVPSGFDRVYRLGSSRPGGERFARMSGGLTAVFPRSQYVATAEGYAAETPAGTVYYIGRLPSSLLEDPEALSRPRASAQRADLYDNRSARGASLDRPRMSAPAGRPPAASLGEGAPARKRPAGAAAPHIVQPTIFNDEEYRARRVGALLDIASRASAPGPNGRP